LVRQNKTVELYWAYAAAIYINKQQSVNFHLAHDLDDPVEAARQILEDTRL
jgi:hypothetical protein